MKHQRINETLFKTVIQKVLYVQFSLVYLVLLNDMISFVKVNFLD